MTGFQAFLLRLAVCAAAACASTGAAAQGWVVEELHTPPHWSAGQWSSWTTIQPSPMRSGDLTTNGFLLSGFTTQSGGSWFGTLEISAALEHGITVSVDMPPHVNVMEDFPQLLQSPHGLRLLASKWSLPGWLVLEAASGNVLANFHLFPIAGYDYVRVEFAQRVVDVDGDGYDEILLSLKAMPTGSTAGECGLAMVSGRTLQPAWLNLEPGSWSNTATWMDPFESVDLDGDGILDPLLNHRRSGGGYSLVISARSGADGALLWETVLGGDGGFGPTSVIPDVTGDGVPDVLTIWALAPPAVGGGLTLLDGATGILQWLIPQSSLLPWAEADGVVWWTGFHAAGSGFGLERNPRTGSQELVLPVSVMRPPAYLHEVDFLRVRPTDGQILEWSNGPEDARPWNDAPLSIANWWPAYVALGDIDRDGLVEWGATIRAPSWPSPLGYSSYQAVVVGRRTLEVPDSVGRGGHLPVQIGIPSAGNMLCVLLASTAFDRRGGSVLDGWRTHLGPSNHLFQATLQSRTFLTSLDAMGRGSFTVPIPNAPALSGESLYLRAVALQPGSMADIYTVSTLGVVEIE